MDTTKYGAKYVQEISKSIVHISIHIDCMMQQATLRAWMHHEWIRRQDLPTNDELITQPPWPKALCMD